MHSLKITGTFLDEISHDIPHQNWGKKEWEADFAHMQEVGIDTVILIRCGHKEWLTYPSDTLSRLGCFNPSIDLVDLFLRLAEQYEMSFYFGLYDSGKYWWEQGDFQKEIDINLAVIDEVWQTYGHRKAFQGWYITQEISRRTKGAIKLYQELGRHCKAVSGNLPTLISPYIDGSKAILSSKPSLTKKEHVTLKAHEEEWQEILEAIQPMIDIVAFQDGQVALPLLSDYLQINKSIMDTLGITCWSNIESFDRDMPIKFLPIKWDKLYYKIQAAQKAGIDKAITFEFSHFMSPQSAYPQAHHLFNRYKEYLHGLEIP